MGRYRNAQHRLHSRIPMGRERALEHIRAAKALSRELGGTDQDVKQYFFSLSSAQLRKILDKYEKEYGRSAREYAENTLPSWKNGKVHMSGMVAERLFNLLPPTMPLEAKFQLTESLWKHVGPSSIKNYYVGPDANLEEISQRIKEHLEEVAIHYQIPNSMEDRFNWLSQGDIRIKQQLLNHFRQLEKRLLLEAIRTQLPILLNHLSNEKGNLTTHTAQILTIGKHIVQVIVNERYHGVSEVIPIQRVSEMIPKQPAESSNYSWVWWVLGAIVLLILNQ